MKILNFKLKIKQVVDRSGFEPLTPCMPCKCSTAELTARRFQIQILTNPLTKFNYSPKLIVVKVTKYPQSNFLIEENGKRIFIDPGNFTFEKYSTNDFPNLDAILITHAHADHLDKEAVKGFITKGVPLYANHDVVSQFKDEDFEITKVEHEKEFEVGGFKIKPIDLPHCQLLFCKEEGRVLAATDIVPGKKVCKAHPDLDPEKVDGPPNTGFVINGILFHPGDGIEISDLTIRNAAIPINGPTIDFERAWKLADSLKAKTIIPMHYTHPTFLTDPNQFAKANPGNIQVIILEDGGSAEIS